jgi:MSHA biogenesis protein MshO
MRTALSRTCAGFTLIEAVIVITLTGIIAAVVAVFIAKPVQGYADSARRADMTDTADTALRRIARDLRLALPNSVRITGGNQAMEFLSTRTGGRYRVALGNGAEDPLDFTAVDTTFDIFGPPIKFAATTLTNQNQIVFSNLGIAGVANAYDGSNRRQYNGAVGVDVSNLSVASASALPPELQGSTARLPGDDKPVAPPRFQVVDTPVSYVCNLAAGTLKRYWGYAISAAQANPPAGGQSALLAQNVSACSFSYSPGVTESSGLVAMQLSITQNNETVTLYHEVHVSNAP